MADEKKAEKEREAAEQVLGKPFAAAMSDATEKIRRNLMVVSCLTVAVVMLGVRVSPTNTLLGISFDGLTEDTLKKGLLAVNVYMLIHFCWCMFDELQEWRLRVTGTRSAYITGGGFGAKHADYPSEPRQSTLHNWWRTHAARIAQTVTAVRSIEVDIDQRIAAEDVPKLTRFPTGAHIELHQIRQAVSTLQEEVSMVKTIVTDPRIVVSLERFDNAFELFLRSQNLRWLVVEAGFPVLLGVWSLGLLIRDVYFAP